MIGAFPQPVRCFVGRRTELDRVLARVDEEVLFFVYGVGGIGKSELAYQLMRELRALPRWSDAAPVLLEIRPGTTAPLALAQLLAAVGSPRAAPTEPGEQLAQLARILNDHPHLVFIDDAHHLPPAEVAEALGYLSRRVERSRLIVASRREIPLAPPPVVTTLGPLDQSAAEQMMAALADRMHLPRPDPESVMRLAHGSPFHIHRALVRSPSSAPRDELSELSPSARRVLVVAAIAQFRPAVEAMRGPTPSLDEHVRELAERFLLEVKDGALVVHDLIREAVLASVAPGELAAAHREAADLCVKMLSAGGAPLLSVDATNHYLAAGRVGEAWGVVERWQSVLAAAGTDHLLPLERLRAALPARRVAIDLLIARGLVRASLFDEASAVLAGVGDDLTDAEAARHAVLAGEIAQRGGDLARAEALFERAAARAPDRDARFQAHLRAATAATLGADGEHARRILEGALAEVSPPTARQRARVGYARTVSWVFDERFSTAVAEARRTRREMTSGGLDDLLNQLAMLETLACIECEDMEGARAAARRIDEAGLRRRVAALYRAIVGYADGRAREVSGELLDAHDYLRSHGDTIHAYLAGHYGSAALAELGRLGEAVDLAQRNTELVQRAGLQRLTARSLAQQAILAAEALQSHLAHHLADQALAYGGPRSRATAHCAHARAYTIEGDIAFALEHIGLARAAVADPELSVVLAAIDVEHAAIDLVGGNLDRAVQYAERALEHYRGRSRNYEVARARLVLAAAYIARGRPTDRLLAESTTAKACELADHAMLRSIQVGCAILAAAAARQADRERAASELLAEALRELDPERGTVYAGTLLAAIDGGVAARAVPGVGALLAHLGFTESVDCYIVDREGRRAATKKDVARERQQRALFVDEGRGAIVGQRGELEIADRPMLCAMLSALIQARGQALSADVLYKKVWGVSEYHALRHRNALYVTINRLRASVRKLLPEREAIERTGDGWRLADGVDACVAVVARQTM